MFPMTDVHAVAIDTSGSSPRVFAAITTGLAGDVARARRRCCFAGGRLSGASTLLSAGAEVMNIPSVAGG
jgi:hypothetical protein